MLGFKYRYSMNPEKGLITLRPTTGAIVKGTLLPLALFGGLVVVGTVLEKIEKLNAKPVPPSPIVHD